MKIEWGVLTQTTHEHCRIYGVVWWVLSTPLILTPAARAAGAGSWGMCFGSHLGGNASKPGQKRTSRLLTATSELVNPPRARPFLARFV